MTLCGVVRSYQVLLATMKSSDYSLVETQYDVRFQCSAPGLLRNAVDARVTG